MSFAIFTTPVYSNCVWNDVCHSINGVDQNCPYDGPGEPMQT